MSDWGDYTPDPWRHGYSDGSGRLEEGGRSGGCIVAGDGDDAVIVGWGTGPDGEAEGVLTTEADARLISKAYLIPRLEAALELLIERLGPGLDDLARALLEELRQP